jgi:hypothetical protein
VLATESPRQCPLSSGHAYLPWPQNPAIEHLPALIETASWRYRCYASQPLVSPRQTDPIDYEMVFTTAARAT